jgi:hypothetical protein
MKLYTPPLFGTDISEYQKVVGPEYPHEVFTCRVHNGYRLDRNFTGNRDSINRNPRVKVKVGYIVPVAGMSNAEAVALTMKVLPKDWGVMIDEESGVGFHGSGDHSVVNNDLRERFLNALGASSRNQVFGYANGSDWATGWRNRGDLHGVVAGYSSAMPSLAKQDWVIGWQYAGGNPAWGAPANFPRSAAGIGNNIDMNVWGFPDGNAMRAWMLGGHASQGNNNTMEDDDVALTDKQAQALDWLADHTNQLSRIFDTTEWTHDRLVGITGETTLWWTLTKDAAGNDKLNIVSPDTPGAKPVKLLDQLDGNTIREDIKALRELISALGTKP